MSVEEARAVTEMEFSMYGRPLTNMTALKYIGCIIAETDEDWSVVVVNLSKSRKK